MPTSEPRPGLVIHRKAEQAVLVFGPTGECLRIEAEYGCRLRFIDRSRKFQILREELLTRRVPE